MLIIEMTMNFSSGIISSASNGIKSTLHLNDSQYGDFASANALGRAIGALIYVPLVNTVSRKWTFIFFLCLKGLLLCCFFLTNQAKILVIYRGLTGLSHMPITIYMQTWVDQYGLKYYKSVLYSLFNATMSIGKLVGYGIVILLKENKVIKYIFFI